MEIVISVFVGVWIVIASVLAHKRIWKEYGPYLEAESDTGVDADASGRKEEV